MGTIRDGLSDLDLKYFINKIDFRRTVSILSGSGKPRKNNNSQKEAFMPKVSLGEASQNCAL
jgi:hypothetical protein